jgi:hypothetical protein
LRSGPQIACNGSPMASTAETWRSRAIRCQTAAIASTDPTINGATGSSPATAGAGTRDLRYWSEKSLIDKAAWSGSPGSPVGGGGTGRSWSAPIGLCFGYQSVGGLVLQVRLSPAPLRPPPAEGAINVASTNIKSRRRRCVDGCLRRGGLFGAAHWPSRDSG